MTTQSRAKLIIRDNHLNMKTGQLRVSLWASRRIKENIIAIIRIINKTTIASEKALMRRLKNL